MALLEVRGLEVAVPARGGPAHALGGVDLDLDRGERLGVLGEPGAGPSTLAFAVPNLVASPGRITGGAVRVGGRNILAMSRHEVRKIRGRRIAMIFRDPMTALTPGLTVGRQMVETLLAHERISRREARGRAIAALARVGVPAPETRFGAYPHELTPGLCQRVVIAMAVLTGADILVADEPTAALDVTAGAGILSLILSLCRGDGPGLLLATRDPAIAAEAGGRIMVMYAGRVVEEGPTRALLDAPRHPYAAALLGALPERSEGEGAHARIPGAMPSPGHVPGGCAFHPRCARAYAGCYLERPELEPDGPERRVACHRPLPAAGDAA